VGPFLSGGDSDGHVHYAAAFGTRPFYDEFLPYVARQAGVETILPGHIPQAVEICERRGSSGVRFIFLLNHSGQEQSISLPGASRDVFNEEDVGGETVLGPYGVRVLMMS
jgi:beta-galactosidase GanA